MAAKKTKINMVAIQPQKANAQQLTCCIAYFTSMTLAAIFMVVACLLPVVFDATAVMCWTCMVLEAASAGFGFLAYWVKDNAL